MLNKLECSQFSPLIGYKKRTETCFSKVLLACLYTQEVILAGVMYHDE